MEVLKPLWWIAVPAAGASLAVTPIVRLCAYRLGVVDRPDVGDAGLKPHGRPVAYLGGVAMCLALLTGLACYVVVLPQLGTHWRQIAAGGGDAGWAGLMANPLWHLLAVAVGAVVITIVGLMDDLRDIQPHQKVGGQLLAAGVLLLGGVGHRLVGTLTDPVLRAWGVPLPLWVEVPLSVLLCIVLVIATCNATNLLDGLDGLCGGVTVIIALGFLGLTVHLAMYDTAPQIDPLRVALCLAMAGAVIGFLPYNLPPATIFMGDAGSMLLGFFVAAMMMLFCKGSAGQATTPRWFVSSLAVFGLPILDTGLAVVRRIRAGRSIFAGDRSHLYDQLVDRGMSVKGVVGLFYVLAAATAGIGVVAAIYLRGRYAMALYGVGLVAVALLFWKLGMVTPEAHGCPEGDNRDETDAPDTL